MREKEKDSPSSSLRFLLRSLKSSKKTHYNLNIVLFLEKHSKHDQSSLFQFFRWNRSVLIFPHTANILSYLIQDRCSTEEKKRTGNEPPITDCIQSELLPHPPPTLTLIHQSAFLLFLRSLSFMMASSHSCFSSGVLAMQTNHLFLAVLWIFQPLFTMFPLLW